MTAVMDIVVKAQDQASQVLEGVGAAGGRAGSLIEQHWMAVTAVTATAGAGIEAMARSQAPLTESTRRLAGALNMTEGEVRDLALGMSNVTFPLTDVLALMESGRQQGIQSADGLRRYAEFWDMVGDATGEAGPQLGEAGAALRTMGVAAGEESQALAAFGFIQQETTGGVGEFLRMIERVGPDLNAMGLDVDDTAALLGVLEREMGLTGTVARRELMSALRDADGDLGQLMGTLGVSAEQFDTYRAKVAESSDVIERNADIHARSYTPMQRLQHGLSELQFRFGGVAAGAANFAPALIAIGPAARGAQLAVGAASAGFSAAGRAFMAMSRLMMANPWILLIVATAALVALIIANWDTIVGFLSGVWDWIQSTVGAVFGWVQDRIGAALDFITALFMNFTGPGLLLKHWDTITGAVAAAWQWVQDRIRQAIDFVVGLFMNFTGPGLLLRHWDTIRAAVAAAWQWVQDRVDAALELVLGILRRFNPARPLGAAWDGVRAGVEAVVGFVTGRFDALIGFFGGIPGRITEVATGMWDGLTGAARDAFNRVAGLWNSTVGRLSFTIPSWVPIIGGNSFSMPRIPTMHAGGRFLASTPGGEGLALLRDRERVLTPEQDTARAAGAGGDVAELLGPLRTIAALLRAILAAIDAQDLTLDGETLTRRVLERAGLGNTRQQARAH